jgi:hypothetical protein
LQDEIYEDRGSFKRQNLKSIRSRDEPIKTIEAEELPTVGDLGFAIMKRKISGISTPLLFQ